MKRTLIVSMAVLALIVVAAVGADAAKKKPKPGPTVVTVPPKGQFLTSCAFSHRLPDDPIVFPGNPGASHSHDFFGNRSTDAFSTYETLRADTATSCPRPGDAAAYWVPTLSQNGANLKPLRTNIYYVSAGHTPGTIKAFPAGLRMIAGNSKATTPQGLRITSWGCAAESGVRDQTTPPICPQGFPLVLRIHFPDCWDGVNLDSPDHKLHMAYSLRGSCPSDHPVAVPRINMNVRYPTLGGSGFALASGGVYSGHADFFNAWDQQTLERNVNICLNGMIHCGMRLP